MSNIKACIFDLDGTLTNTINAIAHFGNIALAAFGLPEIPVEDYKIYVGDGRDKLIHRMLGVYGKDNEEMFEKVRDIIVANLSCDPESVTMEASLTEDLELDSLDAVDLNAALEEELGVAMPDEVLKDVQTVGDIVRYLEEHA